MENLEQLNLIAMRIILDAGDARDFVTKAFEAMGQRDFESADEHLRAAFEKLKSAHRQQTEVIQHEVAAGSLPPSLLFNHAQDTLMVVGSELNLARSLLAIFINIDRRLAQLEAGR
ncbi:PTS lactose/cellobiose transporter subunit IIA [Symbiobacterium thermophilum]|uniref:PTS system cellobiose-specific IIA component n=1 Tax=Symbiobacterium thermophilum (strain DSM 24528 / JCM 14929 / IAM 14863 / T) TaxID=292459 RepID=Q67QV5_SYMTH|nr:PTS lactose/cellobiose transporter subunit IIA [Symbiobacterium thermophilum]BAD39938.1 PTS system cellobiose-specific IIA component [Symbiobacterium thermophilum IAM 14863]